MRFHVAFLCAVVFAGCQSPHRWRNETAGIANSLEKRVTAEEARHILFDFIDRIVQAGAPNNKDSREELEIWSNQRRQLSSKLEFLLSRSRKGYELWSYRTYATPNRSGGSSGFALVRDGSVVEYMHYVIYD